MLLLAHKRLTAEPSRKTGSSRKDVTHDRAATRSGESISPVFLSSHAPKQEVERAQVHAHAPRSAGDEHDFSGTISVPAWSGHSIPSEVRTPMELAFQCEFAGVRLHDDGEADFLSRSMGARAFTFGQHVFFRTGAFAPHQPEGQRLLAHELAHVVEQRSTGERRIQRQPENKPTQLPARLKVPSTQAEYEAWQRTHRNGTSHVIGSWWVRPGQL